MADDDLQAARKALKKKHTMLKPVKSSTRKKAGNSGSTRAKRLRNRPMPPGGRM